MYVVKSLNNNLVLAINETKEEFVLFGRGIGFNKKQGDKVDQDLITKTFLSQDTSYIVSLTQEIDTPYLAVSEKIISFAEAALDKTFNSILLFNLADHIQQSITRYQQQLAFPDNGLQWDIPILYGKEYQLGKQAIELINQEFSVALTDSEASAIALHLINAQSQLETMNDTMMVTQVLKEIVKKIQILFNVSLEKDTPDYARFVTHIRYLVTHQLHRDGKLKVKNGELYKIIKEQYPKSYACALVIKEMLETDYGFDINADELIYLIIHIERIIK